MRASIPSIRGRLDRFGVVLSGLCAIHCLLGLLLVTALGLGAGALLHPAVHKVGLALAVVVGALTIGLGALRHGRTGPLAAGVLWLCLMSAGVGVGHGWHEAVLTIAGVALVALAHIANLRHAA
jgi:hypothetical protein